MSEPKIIKGNFFRDHRGTLTFNNDFDMSNLKRIYFIENVDCDFVRAWQGHKIEKRYFSAIKGSFLLKIKKIENWSTPDKNCPTQNFELNSEGFDVLVVPEGHITSIQALQEGSKLAVMSDYALGEINDEYRFPADYFEN